MQNILNISSNGTPELLSRIDADENTLFINGSAINSSEWVGTGQYTFTVGGVNYVINKISENTGNIMLEHVSGTLYQLLKIIDGGGGGYATNDYEQLINKPQIEGVTLIGNKVYEDLNLQSISNSELEELLT